MGSWKTERELDAVGLPEFLRELAQALETGAAEGLLDGLLPGGLHELLLVAERRDAGLCVKLKAKGERGSRPEKAHHVKARAKDQAGGKAQAGREKYSQLKKAMGADFKALRAAVEAGRMPQAETLESFLGLAEAMARGDQPVSGAALTEMAQANTAFLDDCQALRRAFSARDVGALASVLERLARRKSACHAQFRQKERP